jgi:hypothetical protein
VTRLVPSSTTPTRPNCSSFVRQRTNYAGPGRQLSTRMPETLLDLQKSYQYSIPFAQPDFAPQPSDSLLDVAEPSSSSQPAARRVQFLCNMEESLENEAIFLNADAEEPPLAIENLAGPAGNSEQLPRPEASGDSVIRDAAPSRTSAPPLMFVFGLEEVYSANDDSKRSADEHADAPPPASHRVEAVRNIEDFLGFDIGNVDELGRGTHGPLPNGCVLFVDDCWGRSDFNVPEAPPPPSRFPFFSVYYHADRTFQPVAVSSTMATAVLLGPLPSQREVEAHHCVSSWTRRPLCVPVRPITAWPRRRVCASRE